MNRAGRYLVAFSLSLVTGPVWSGPPNLLDRLIAAETGCGPFCPPADSSGNLRAQVDHLADQAEVSISTQKDAVGRVQSLNRFVSEQLGLRPSRDLTDPDNLLLARILERNQGYCVGLASLYLVFAERLRLPIYAVATPSHVFLRYDDGATRINIETLQSGANVRDDQYIREERIPQESIRRGVFMRDLTADEFLAQVHNNLGVIDSGRGLFEQAAAEYRGAIDLAPRFPAPYYNHGNDLLKQGRYRKAVRYFSRSLRLYRTDVWALNNRGLALCKEGKARRAHQDFRAALALDPNSLVAAKNLESNLCQRAPDR